MGGVPIIGDLLGPPKVPKAPAIAALKRAPDLVDPSVIQQRQQRRKRASSVLSTTTRTSPQGLSSEASTTKKSLLGT